MTVEALKQLSTALEKIQNIALELHEEIELTKFERPLFNLERRIMGPTKTVATHVLASLFWNILLFSEALSKSHEQFQVELKKRLVEPSLSLLWRQLNTQRLKLWTYRRSLNQRGIGRQLAGPQQYHEFFFDDIISADSFCLQAEHYTGFACSVQWREKNILVLFSQVPQSQTYVASDWRPYPINQDDEIFWEEAVFHIIREMSPSQNYHRNVTSNDLALAYNPELRLMRLQCLIQDVNKIWYSKKTPMTLRALLAKSIKGEALGNVLSLFSQRDYVTDGTDPGTPSVDRFLLALGIDQDGECSKAHRSILMNDPIALLLLDPESELSRSFHPREGIRQALQWEVTRESKCAHEAFSQYEIEQRWCTTFECLDMNQDEHVMICSLTGIISDLEFLFPSRFFEMPLVMPQGVLLKYFLDLGLGQEKNTMRDFLSRADRVLTSKQQFLSLEIIRWVLVVAKTWRNILSEVDVRESGKRIVTNENRKRLEGGLSSLSALFQKESS